MGGGRWCLIALLVSSGCIVEIDYAGTQFQCVESTVCPDGLVCQGGVCVEATDGGAGGDFLAGYSRRKPLSITGGVASADVSDAVIGIVIASDSDLAAGADSSGGDIVFTLDDGQTVLPHELEKFDSATGELVAWVRLQTLPASGLSLFAYYDGVIVTPDVAGTWSGFSSVWHFGGTDVGAISVATDSATGNDATAISGSEPVAAVAIAGTGAEFAATGRELVVGDPADDSLDFDLGSFTYSVWVNVTTSAGNFDIPWHKGGSNAGNVGFDMELGIDSWNACVSDAIDNFCVDFGTESEFLGGWVHLVAVVDRDQQQLRTYADGTMRNTGDIAALGSTSGTAEATISRDTNGFNGVLDEVRVRPGALSDDAIALEHANLTNAGFVTVGAEQVAL